ncbi:MULTISPECIES: hypothetical protein [unclassified Streptomyces]|uniref:hypothetical protein n=1 Tax=unclassified Streptomyces TaxID=2593676 RepID=UPI001660FBDC|nr:MULTISPECIES: hypothetical protein [unclassified Streptomyces]
MAEHSIAAYKIVVHRRQKKEPLKFDNFDGNGNDLLKVLHGYLQSLKEDGFDNPDNKQILKSPEITHSDRRIHATLGLGEYGVTSKFEERGSGTPRFNREQSDVEFLLYRNLLVLPKEREVGLFLTERIHNRGVFSMFSTGLRRAFRKRFGEYVIEVSNLSPEAAVSRVLDSGQVKKIRLVRNSVPRDIADRYELNQHETELGTMETVISSPRRGSLGKRVIEKVVRGQQDVSSLLEWQGVDYSDLRVEVRVGRTIRTVSVASGKTPVVTFEINEDLLDDDGVLSDSAFYQEAMKVALDLAEDISLTRQSVAEQQFTWPDSWNEYRLEVPPSEDAEP